MVTARAEGLPPAASACAKGPLDATRARCGAGRSPRPQRTGLRCQRDARPRVVNEGDATSPNAVKEDHAYTVRPAHIRARPRGSAGHACASVCPHGRIAGRATGRTGGHQGTSGPKTPSRSVDRVGAARVGPSCTRRGDAGAGAILFSRDPKWPACVPRIDRGPGGRRKRGAVAPLPGIGSRHGPCCRSRHPCFHLVGRPEAHVVFLDGFLRFSI